MKEAYQLLKKYIKENDTIVVAVSGGPDSMALLHLLLDYRSETPFQIVCAHVNHKVRKESDEEEIFVQNYCNEHNVIFECYQILNYDGNNFHEDARNKRYKFFENVLTKYNSQLLLTAHHGDDLTETILMRMVRGSSLKGMSGFEVFCSRKNYFMLRPLLYETKSSILEYLEKKQINYVTDSSNLKDVYTRNRYRKYILPVLKEENPKVHKKFLQFSETILEVEEYVGKYVNKLFSKLYENDKLNLSELKKEDSFLQKRVLMYYLELCYQDDLSLICDKHISELMKLICSSKKNGEIMLPQRTFVKRGDFLYEKKEIPSSYSFLLENVNMLPNGKTICVEKESLENTNNICRLSYSDIVLPLTIRTIQNGDRMTVKNMHGTKKLNDIFTDCKIPLEERKVYPIVVDGTGKIVWLPGLKKSKFDIENTGKCDIILKYY